MLQRKRPPTGAQAGNAPGPACRFDSGAPAGSTYSVITQVGAVCA